MIFNDNRSITEQKFIVSKNKRISESVYSYILYENKVKRLLIFYLERLRVGF